MFLMKSRLKAVDPLKYSTNPNILMRDLIALKDYYRSKIPTHSEDEDKELLPQALIKINNLKRKSTFKLKDDIVNIPSKTTPSITTDTVPLYQVPQQQPTDTVPLYQVPQQQPTDVVPMYHVPQQGPANVVPMYQMPQQQQTTDAVPLYQMPQPNYMPYYPMYYFFSTATSITINTTTNNKATST